MIEPDLSQTAKPPMIDRLLMVLPAQVRPLHIAFYKATGGLFAERLTWGAPLLLMTTTGRVTGEPRTVIVGYLRSGNDLILVGTNGGSRKLPAWVHNLRAHPHATVRIRRNQFPARVEFVDADELDGYWQQLVREYPSYEYSERLSGREYPLVRLVRLHSPEA